MRSLSNFNTRVILIRHGRSTFNQLQRYQGSSDASVLTEQGYETARRAGEFLKNESIDALYSSPLKRVQQTANLLIEGLSCFPKRLEIHSDLREIEMFNWEGRSYQEVQQSEPEAYQCWQQQPHEFRLRSTEIETAGSLAVATQTDRYPVLDLFDRTRQFWQEILPRHRGKTIAIVSHGGTNRALISTAIGLAPARFHSLQQSNCGISILNFTSGFTAQLETLNLTTPIGETLPKLKSGKQGLRLLLLPVESDSSSAIHLSNLLQNVAIDFSLTSTANHAQLLTTQLLHPHHQTVKLQSSKPQFLLEWQRTIAAKSHDSADLMTGVVVAPRADIQQFLATAIGLNPDHHDRLQIQPGSLSILHYPTANHTPVIQALNFA